MRKRFLLVSAILIVVASTCLLAACHSPLAVAGRTDLSLNFIISGRRPMSRADGAKAAAQSRLILPTASTIVVTLLSEPDGAAVTYGPFAIGAGDNAVSVPLTGIRYGQYTISADVYDAEGIRRFTQTASGLRVAEEVSAVRLNLVPTSGGGAELAPETLHEIDLAGLAAGESVSWLLAPDSRLLAASSIFLSGLNDDMLVFLQEANGRLQSQSGGLSARLHTVGLPAGQAAYLTVYNGSPTALATTRAFPGPVMVSVPGGAFQRDVTAANISQVSAFSMAALEVTRELYLAVMGSGGNPDPAHPMNNIGWYEALVFCNRLSLMEGLQPVYSINGSSTPADWGGVPAISDADWNAVVRNPAANGYRLPTNMEWIWAAMGADTDARPGSMSGGVNVSGFNKLFAGSDGSNLADDYAWHQGNSGGLLQPAGTKLPNELGLYDLTGNVREICWDWYEATNPGGELLDYTGAASNVNVHRSWLGIPSDVAPVHPLAAQAPYNAYVPHSEAGLRVASGALPSYTISYHANGATSGTVPAAPATLFSGQTFTVQANTGNLVGESVRAGIYQRYIGWNTFPNGTGTAYVSSDAIVVGSDLVLFAHYTTDASPVGKIGPAGGYVFYDAGSPQTDVAGTWQYMEVAPANTEFANIWWLSTAVNTGQTFNRYAVGQGKANSAEIASYLTGLGESNRAAQVCEALVSGGYDDWYLPTHDELKHVYLNVHAISLGGFSTDPFDARYWSCSEYSSGAFYVNFANTYNNFGEFMNDSFSKPSNLRVRAVRRF